MIELVNQLMRTPHNQYTPVGLKRITVVPLEAFIRPVRDRSRLTHGLAEAT